MDLESREILNLPVMTNVDFRGTCFCHQKVVDFAYVCSSCLSSKYFFFILFLKIITKF